MTDQEENVGQEERIDWLRDRGVEIEFPNDRKKKDKKVVAGRSVKVVKVPCDDNLPFEEITISVEKGKNGDQLLQFLRIYFNQGSIELESLQESAAKQFSNESVNISQNTVEKLASFGSVECFPLSHPNTANNQTKVGLYLDEAGQLKKLALNKRAVALAKSCGFDDVPLVGDMFVGRVGPLEGLVTNLDFSLEDLDSSKATWLQDIKKENYEHGVSTNRVTMDSSSAPQEGVDTRGFRWSENGEIVEVIVSVPAQITKVSSKDLKIKFTSKSLLVQIKNTTSSVLQSPFDASQQAEPQSFLTLLDIPQLVGSIHADDSTWSVSGRDIELSLEKADGSVKWNGKLQK